MKKKNPSFLSHVSPTDSLGIRIPDHEFTKTIILAGKPFITTSLNYSGEPPITSINEIPEDMKSKADIIIDAGALSGKPSTLVINGKEFPR